MTPTPPPGSASGDTVFLDQFDFFKSANADSAANVQVAIINNIFGNLTNLSTSSSLFVGLSTNTVASTAPLATGAPIAFDFDNLPLTFGNAPFRDHKFMQSAMLVKGRGVDEPWVPMSDPKAREIMTVRSPDGSEVDQVLVY